MVVNPKHYRFSRAEYHRMVDAGILSEDSPVELIDGEILEMSPIGRPHTSCLDRLNRTFVRGVGDKAIVRIQGPVVLSEYHEPEPDLLLLRPRPDFYAEVDATAEAVLLAIEVADSSVEYDRQVKAPLYSRHAIPEYWLVDVGRHHIVVYRDPTPAGYATTRLARPGETISPLAFPGLQLAVAEILA